MKNQWKVLGVSAFVLGTSAFAQSNGNGNGSCDPCAPCEPCCVPKPKKCIDCVCYTAPFYELQCDWGMFLDAEFLYWYGRENNLITSVTKTVIANNETLSPSANPLIACPTDYNFISSCWDPGVRVGIGINSDCDGWDYSFFWTWFKNKESAKKSVPNWEGGVPIVGGKFLTNPWAPALSPIAGFNKTNAKWEFTYNNFDLVMGRRYYLSQCFTLRPFAGLRGTWTETDLNLTFTRETYESDDTLPTFTNDVLSQKYDNEAWGVGLVGGIQPAFFFTPCFSLFGELAASLVWGKHSHKSSEAHFAEQGILVDDLDVLYDFTCTAGKNQPSWMQPQIDLAIGLRWEDTYCCDRYSFGLDLGWEHHVLLSHNLRARSEVVGSENTVDDDSVIDYQQQDWQLSDVGFGGFVLRVRFDF